jgi:hypothetical protein
MKVTLTIEQPHATDTLSVHIPDNSQPIRVKRAIQDMAIASTYVLTPSEPTDYHANTTAEGTPAQD